MDYFAPANVSAALLNDAVRTNNNTNHKANNSTLVGQVAIKNDSYLDDINHWANRYFHTFAVNASPHTQRAKRSDIQKLLNYFADTMKSAAVDLWTPALTRGFQNYLSGQVTKTQNPYAATTINRIMATLSHFAAWLITQRPLLAGNPFAGVRMTQVEEPSWNGLTATEIMRLKSACDIRRNACNKKHQDPLLEATVFHALLHTGLRESELASLNYGQYYARGFHEVKRKGNKVSRKIPVPAEAKELLDQLVNQRLEQLRVDRQDVDIGPADPLFVSRYGARISTRDIARACDRIANQASAHTDAKIRLTPHMLRHTFLKRVADKHGVHVAQDLSGNISMREIFRYTKPSHEQKQAIVEQLY